MRKNGDKMKKCEHGYINKEKRKRMMLTISYALIGVAIFLFGFFINNKSKTNIFTVVAILSVLPASKQFVGFIVFFPFKTVAAEKYERIRAMLTETATLLTDYVFTSEQKIMALDYLVLENGNAIGLITNEKQDINYIKNYLSKGIHNLSSNYRVKIANSEEEFLDMYQGIVSAEITENQNKAVLDWLRSLAV